MSPQSHSVPDPSRPVSGDRYQHNVQPHSAVCYTTLLEILLLCFVLLSLTADRYHCQLLRPYRPSPSVCLSVCLFVCLFVCSLTQKRMIPKCSNLVQGMTLGYHRSVTVLGFKGQGHRVNKCIFHTNVRSITQKRMKPRCLSLVQGMTLRYHTGDMVLG